MHVHASGGGKGYTLHSAPTLLGMGVERNTPCTSKMPVLLFDTIHPALTHCRRWTGITLHVYSDGGHPAHPHCILWKRIHLYVHTAGGEKGNILTFMFLTVERETPHVHSVDSRNVYTITSTHCQYRKETPSHC